MTKTYSFTHISESVVFNQLMQFSLYFFFAFLFTFLKSSCILYKIFLSFFFSWLLFLFLLRLLLLLLLYTLLLYVVIRNKNNKKKTQLPFFAYIWLYGRMYVCMFGAKCHLNAENVLSAPHITRCGRSVIQFRVVFFCMDKKKRKKKSNKTKLFSPVLLFFFFFC